MIDLVRTLTTAEGFAVEWRADLPPRGSAPRPGVLLIPGSMPSDVDHTLPGSLTVSGREVLFWKPFIDAAVQRGLVVARFGKRGVRRTLEAVDAKAYRTTSLVNEMADTQQALDALRQTGGVDPDRLALLGWSEGTDIAARVGGANPSVRALVLIGVVGTSWRELIEQTAGPEAAGFLQAIAKMPDEAMVGADRPALRLKQLLAEGRNADRILAAKVPVLVAHGEDDMETPSEQARAVEAAFKVAGRNDLTLRIYPGLNHALVRVPKGVRLYGSPDPEAVGETMDWLAQRLSR